MGVSPPKGGVASRKHPRCRPPVHWLTGWFVCCRRVTPHTHPGPCSCCPSCHPVHPLVHLVWTVLQHFIHKGRRDPPGHHFCRLVSHARPVSSPIRDRRRSQVNLHITLQPMTACIFKFYCLTTTTTTSASQFPAFCYKVPKRATKTTADLQCAGAPLLRAALTLDRLAQKQYRVQHLHRPARDSPPLSQPDRPPPQSAVQDRAGLNPNRPDHSSRDSSQCSNY